MNKSVENENIWLIILLAISIYLYLNLGGSVADIIRDVSKSLVLILLAVILVREFGIKLRQ